MAKKVSIFICGVQKGGTSSLHAHFAEHPGLSAPRVKEVHFFDDEWMNWSAPNYRRLDAQFQPGDGDRPRFESTPIYSFWPNAIARLHVYNPAARLILLFRDPFDRAWSHWRMEFSRGEETLPFAAAIRANRRRIDPRAPNAPDRVYSYVERGLYAEQVRRVLALFPREQVLFLRSADFWRDHVAVLDRIARFLGIARFPDSGAKHELPGSSIAPPALPTEADHGFIAGIVQNDVRAFAALTGLDVSDWAVMQPAPAAAAPAAAAPATAPRRAGSPRPNVLFMSVDDLNGWVGALGRQPDARTPAIDALARRGTLFSHAYCAAPSGHASRMSVFTGCLPATTGIYGNEPYWDMPDRRVTYFETMKQAGYQMFGAGNIFAGGYDYAGAARTGAAQALWTGSQNRLSLWDRFEAGAPEPLPDGRPLNRLFDFGRPDAMPQGHHQFDWGALPDAAAPLMPDEITCQAVEALLAAPPTEPFFCAAGIYKPHMPWHVPRRFFDLYDPARIRLPLVRQDDLDDVPAIAKKWALTPADHDLINARGQWRHAVQAYLAAMSYADWIIGRMVAALDRAGLAENTIIALWSDNGFHLGEKSHWRGAALWEESTRVPLIIVPPAGFRREAVCYDPVSLIDVFPTIAALCGVPGPSGVDGRSLVGAMTDPRWTGRPVLTTCGAGNHSIRAGDWRYTRYAAGGEELYNHRLDPHEWTNLTGDPRFTAQLDWLRSATPP